MNKKDKKEYLVEKLIPNAGKEGLKMVIENDERIIVTVYAKLTVEKGENGVVITAEAIELDHTRSAECPKTFYFRYESISPQRGREEEYLAAFRQRDPDTRKQIYYLFC